MSVLAANLPPTRLYHAQVTPDEAWGTTPQGSAVQEERLRKRRTQWTRNVVKVRDMEYKRLHALTGAEELEGVPDFSRGCSNPILLTLIAGNQGGRLDLDTVQTQFMTKCGRSDCYECSTRRRQMWAARAHAEIQSASRTWFVTLTARPEQMSEWFREAGVEYSPGIGRHLLSHQYDAVVKAAYKSVQLWKKRLARSRRGLRFLFTVEKHTGTRGETAWHKAGMGDFYGLPHFHGFVHEAEVTVPYQELKRISRDIGFFRAKLVNLDDEPFVWYLCKYISKVNGGRNLWPSFRYGRLTNGQIGLGADLGQGADSKSFS